MTHGSGALVGRVEVPENLVSEVSRYDDSVLEHDNTIRHKQVVSVLPVGFQIFLELVLALREPKSDGICQLQV